jgi:hypothetical protein
MRVDPLPKQTPVTITAQANGYAATLTNITLNDGSKPRTIVHPTIAEAIAAARELAADYQYTVI